MTITRTGYTGDLGYELWVAPQHAERLSDVLMDKGHGYGITPAGIIALDIARVEAGLLLIEVDYISADKASIEAQKSSPFEIGLGWAVALDKGDFVAGERCWPRKRMAPNGLLLGWILIGLPWKNCTAWLA